jgi:hypothetical protein
VNSTSQVNTSVSGSEGASMQAELEKLQQRQKRLAELLNCPPEKIEHEIRNVLNELKLLRTLFESQDPK